ncbi:diacylglycerol o-acyltransferase, putative [Perkinsus marinus ATCC 50983]|uniref:Acyltransferase n=1 Tax=Perkinsus marinus (strain ATCC 50983 / TXsc) TaxID=423536 RepID=C5LH18_PERM5|nr:diacylglycerol o-acyltransferase, putative [Perkinsus marinus ATCC 50983]EER03989.1 diacylglycerol o-acyltransferase, putative [Perkinsus marinus ATCC 50983]|eukprot:XP_002772173.1 diacylglycerol o-acyltransferase, putative [Perkinsus marinus ATCC 50983]
MPGGSEEKLPFGQGTPAWLDYFASVTGCKALVEEYLKLTHDYSSVRELYDPYDAKAVERMLLEMLLQKFRDLNGQTSPIEEDSSADTDADDVLIAPLSLPVYTALTDKHFDLVTQVLSHALENLTKDKKAGQALTDQVINTRDDIVSLLLPKQGTRLAEEGDSKGGSSSIETLTEPVAACHAKRGGADDEAKQVFGLDFAPTKVPPHRRREMMACLFIFSMQLVSLLLACLAIYCWRVTWPFIVAYATYVYIDTKYYTRHIRPVGKFFRNSPLMRNFAKYFPVHLIRDEPASSSFTPKKSYMIGYHPHGILSIGASTAYGTDASGFDQKFPGITPRLCTLSPIEVTQKDHPTSDDIEALKEKYIAALRALFDKWKVRLQPNAELIIL